MYHASKKNIQRWKRVMESNEGFTLYTIRLCKPWSHIQTLLFPQIFVSSLGFYSLIITNTELFRYGLRKEKVNYTLLWGSYMTLLVLVFSFEDNWFAGMARPVFVGNFEHETRQSDLERLFSKYGRVERVDMKSGKLYWVFLSFC